MIIYNVTCNVDSDIHDQWLVWMREEHLPEVMATKLFVDYRFLRLLDQAEGETGCTYAIQYRAVSLAHYQQYIDDHAPALRAKTYAKFGDKVMAFRTLLEQVK